MVCVRRAEAGEAGAVRDILRECSLPTDDFSDGDVEFLVAEDDGAIVGTIGLESYPPAGLLRSAAVLPSHRGLGLGALLTEALLREARSKPLKELLLLTSTAEGFFARMGFTVVTRESLSGPLLSSRQFTGARCSSAVVMRIGLG
jgi:N-acetylglutamate synthase-like GNAT family acetyltransferase